MIAIPKEDKIGTGWNNKRARPKYLQGQKAKIVGHKTVNVVIELDSPSRRFGGRITCPTGIIDKELN